jgi:hypothetical protein
MEIEYGIVWILDIVVQPIKFFVEYVGIIIVIQVLLLIIDWRSDLDHVHIFLNP